MEQIAVLDGLDITPVPGGGQNYSGGSSWSPGFPYRLQQEGLAGAMGVLRAVRPGMPSSQAIRISRETAARAMATMPRAMRGNAQAAAYAAALHTAMSMGLSMDRARAVSRQVVDTMR